MSKVCALCGKRPVAGNNVSHSKRRTRRRFLPNLVSKKFAGVKIQICTRCLRTLQKPVRIKNKGLRIQDKGLRNKETEKSAKDELVEVETKVAEKKVEKKASAEK